MFGVFFSRPYPPFRSAIDDGWLRNLQPEFLNPPVPKFQHFAILQKAAHMSRKRLFEIQTRACAAAPRATESTYVDLFVDFFI